MNMNKLSIIALMLTLGLTAGAEVKLPQILSDGMVVQQGRPLTLWGTADPGEQFEIKVVKGKKATVTTDSLGQWRAQLPPLKPGKKYTLEVGDKSIDNVAVGTVLLCSGQSNMELPVSRVLDRSYDTIMAYKNPDIRQFHVPNEVEFTGPQADVKPTRWQSADTDDVLGFSAVAYWTARNIAKKTGTPVGIINASWGGTPIESWISEETFEHMPADSSMNPGLFLAQKRVYNDPDYRKALKDQEWRNYQAWNTTIDANDPGLNGPVKYYSPELDDSDWAEYDLFSTLWGNDDQGPRNGSHWLRKTVTIDADHAGKPGFIRMGCVIDADSVYINGRQVGFTSYQYPPRVYPIPEGLLKEGENVITVRLISQNGTPMFMPEKPYKIIFGDRPYPYHDGRQADEIPLLGNWKYRQGAQMPKGPDMMFFCYLPSVLYNSMIAPVIKYPVEGVLWYQGESNVGRRKQYPALMKAWIDSWRAEAGDPAMPFYIVELADYLHPSDKWARVAWQEMRDLQRKACDEIPGATLVPNADLGEWNDIHPLDKDILGARAAELIIQGL